MIANRDTTMIIPNGAQQKEHPSTGGLFRAGQPKPTPKWATKTCATRFVAGANRIRNLLLRVRAAFERIGIRVSRYPFCTRLRRCVGVCLEAVIWDVSWQADTVGGAERTRAKASFEDNWSTIEHLLTVGKPNPRTHDQIAAVNRAALVFVITAWESYVEDVVREATDHLSRNCPSFAALPKPVSKSVLKQVTPSSGLESKSPSGKYPQDLADDGWRGLLRSFALQATSGSNCNTPNSKNVKRLFEDWCGLDVTTAWSWQRFESPKAAQRLDDSIELRGEIIHTGVKPDGLNANWVSTYGEKNIRKLVNRTDQILIDHVNRICGNSGSFP